MMSPFRVGRGGLFQVGRRGRFLCRRFVLVIRQPVAIFPSRYVARVAAAAVGHFTAAAVFCAPARLRVVHLTVAWTF